MYTAIGYLVTPFLLCLSFLLSPFSVVLAATMPPTAGFADMIERVKPAVVHLSVKKSASEQAGKDAANREFFNDQLMADFFGEREVQPSEQPAEDRSFYGRGSGFIISSDGYILTNAHVIANAEQITAFLADRRSLPAKIVGIDPLSDLALLRVQGSNLITAELSNSQPLRPGDWAIAIGAPMEQVQTVTAGIISAIGRHSLGISDYEDFIQTDAAINPGNSGGPLMNTQGRVIGVNTAFLTQTGGYTGIGFAIPIDMVKVIAERLRQDGKVVRGWLGAALKDADQETIGKAGVNGGALVHALEENSPARRAALRRGDLIVALDGAPVTSAAEVRNRVALAKPGTSMQFRLLRDGKQVTATAVLGEKK